jgi:hypothetical protein
VPLAGSGAHAASVPAGAIRGAASELLAASSASASASAIGPHRTQHSLAVDLRQSRQCQIDPVPIFASIVLYW